MLNGFLDELDKIAITRPAIEWYPSDHTSDESAFLHSTAEGDRYFGETFIPKQMKGGHKTPKKKFAENTESVEPNGNTDHANEISDANTARQISYFPPSYRKNK